MAEHLKSIPDADHDILRFEMNREGFETFARVMFPEKSKNRTPAQVQADRDRIIGHFWAGALQMNWSDKKSVKKAIG